MRILPPPIDQEEFKQFIREKHKREALEEELRPMKRWIPIQVFIEEKV